MKPIKNMYLCNMNNIQFDFYSLDRAVKTALREDQIESALELVFSFLEKYEEVIAASNPPRLAVGISASVARLRTAFIRGIIDWEQTYKIRGELVEQCLTLLEYLRREVESGGVEKRNYPHISGFPHLSIVQDCLERIERLLPIH